MSNKFCKDNTSIQHTEATCHAIGEKRQNLINKLKIFLDQVDDRPCLVKDGRQTSRRKPMIKYPGYVDYHHPAFKLQKLEDCLRPMSQTEMTKNNYCKQENHLDHHIDELEENSHNYDNHCQNMDEESHNINWHQENQEYLCVDDHYNYN